MIVWVASYPRSGNTFFRTVLHGAFGLNTWSIYPEGHSGGGVAGKMTGHRAFGPDFRLEDAAERDEIYCVKTHGPPKDNGKAIYLVRDGRASMASFYHYIRNFSGKEPTIQDVITGNVMFGSWSDHLTTWEPQQRPDTLLIKFEEIVANPAKYYPALEEFLGIKANADAKVPEFEQLKACNAKFFRSGTNDAWRSDFSDDDHTMFWALHGHVMAEYGYGAPPPEVRRAIQDAWRLAGDSSRLRKELNDLTASRTRDLENLAKLRAIVNSPQGLLVGLGRLAGRRIRSRVTAPFSRILNRPVAVSRRN